MLSVSVLALLISSAVAVRRDKSILYSRTSLGLLAFCFIISIASFQVGFQGKGLGLFGGLYHDTVISHAFQVFVFIITFLILQLNSFFFTKITKANLTDSYTKIISKLNYLNFLSINRISQQYKIIEYPLVILFVLTGGVFLMSSSDIISIFISIELQSYALYILCAIYRDSERATSAGLTYFLLGGLSSCFILLGLGLLYSNSGNTGIDGLYVINAIIGAKDGLAESIPLASSVLAPSGMGVGIVESMENIDLTNYINFPLAFMSVGFLFKVSAAPFHFWSPDVYDAIPTVVTTFVAVFAKISILVLLLELVHYTTNIFTATNDTELVAEYLNNRRYWTFTLLISSFLSLIIGSVLGLTQSRIKRLFAYSTISHLGFLLLALTMNSVESIQSFIFYLMQYSLSNLNAFILLIAVGYTLFKYINTNKDMYNINSVKNSNSLETGSYSLPQNALVGGDRNNSPIQLITDIKGFFYINPMISISLAITLFSFVGVPPLIGFFAKQMVLTSALDNGYIFMALIGILTSVISAVYYLLLVKQIFFDKTDYRLESPTIKVDSSDSTTENSGYLGYNFHLTSSLTGTISVLTLIILLFMIVPQEWLHMTTILTLIIFNT